MKTNGGRRQSSAGGVPNQTRSIRSRSSERSNQVRPLSGRMPSARSWTSRVEPDRAARGERAAGSTGSARTPGPPRGGE